VRRPIRTLDVTTAPFASIGLNFATEQPSEAKAVIERSLAAGDRLLERGSFEAGDLTIYRGINGDFHDTVLAASRNRMLGEMIRTCHRVPASSSRNIVAFEHRDVRRRHAGDGTDLGSVSPLPDIYLRLLRDPVRPGFAFTPAVASRRRGTNVVSLSTLACTRRPSTKTSSSRSTLFCQPGWSCI